MLKKIATIITVAILMSSCGLTPIQKQQVAQFATATELVSISTQENFKSMRDKVIEMQKRRSIIRNVVPTKTFLEDGIKTQNIAIRIEALKALQSYGNILNKLALNNQTEEISKAATEFLSQYESTIKLGGGGSFILSEVQKNVILEIINIASFWFVEEEKKKHIKNIVMSFASETLKLAKLLENDLILASGSLCNNPEMNIETSEANGMIDIYCAVAYGLEKASLVAIKQCHSFEERKFAYESYVVSLQAKKSILILSAEGSRIIAKFKKANAQLLKVIKYDNYTADDIKSFARQVQELLTLTKLITK